MKQKFKHSIKTMVLISFLTISQAWGQQVTYKVTEDNPYALPNFFINLYPVNMDIASPMALRFGAGVEYKMNKVLSFRADLEKGYFNSASGGAVKKNGTSVEAGGAFTFSTKQKTKSVKVPVEAGNTYSTTLKVDNATVIKDLGIRGGLYLFGSQKETENKTNVLFNTTGIYAGFSSVSTRNIEVDIDGYGKRRARGKNNFYVDALFSPLISYSYNGTDTSKNNSAYLDSILTKKPIGWRIGYMMYVKTKAIPILYGFEIGQRTGLNIKSTFMFIKFSIPIGFDVANNLKEKK